MNFEFRREKIEAKRTSIWIVEKDGAVIWDYDNQWRIFARRKRDWNMNLKDGHLSDRPSMTNLITVKGKNITGSNGQYRVCLRNNISRKLRYT